MYVRSGYAFFVMYLKLCVFHTRRKSLLSWVSFIKDIEHTIVLAMQQSVKVFTLVPNLMHCGTPLGTIRGYNEQLLVIDCHLLCYGKDVPIEREMPAGLRDGYYQH